MVDTKIPVLTKFETARLLGTRVEQLDGDFWSNLETAKKELYSGRLPLALKRGNDIMLFCGNDRKYSFPPFCGSDGKKNLDQ